MIIFPPAAIIVLKNLTHISLGLSATEWAGSSEGQNSKSQICIARCPEREPNTLLPLTIMIGVR